MDMMDTMDTMDMMMHIITHVVRMWPPLSFASPSQSRPSAEIQTAFIPSFFTPSRTLPLHATLHSPWPWTHTDRRSSSLLLLSSALGRNDDDDDNDDDNDNERRRRRRRHDPRTRFPSVLSSPRAVVRPSGSFPCFPGGIPVSLQSITLSSVGPAAPTLPYTNLKPSPSSSDTTPYATVRRQTDARVDPLSLSFLRIRPC